MNYPGNDPAILLIELQHIKFRCVLDSRKCIYICAWYLDSGQIKTAIKNHVREKKIHITHYNQSFHLKSTIGIISVSVTN